MFESNGRMTQYLSTVSGALIALGFVGQVSQLGDAFYAFAFTILHLRHSELPFCATGWLGRLIQSPAHHQIHHSTKPEHHDRNLGFCLSLWDWVFGTLCLPERGARYVYGLGEDDPALRTATGSLLAPFRRAAGRAVHAQTAPEADLPVLAVPPA